MGHLALPSAPWVNRTTAVAARIWVAVEMELVVKQLAELFPPDRPALFALLREKWRAQRQAEEHRGYPLESGDRWMTA